MLLVRWWPVRGSVPMPTSSWSTPITRCIRTVEWDVQMKLMLITITLTWVLLFQRLCSNRDFLHFFIIILESMIKMGNKKKQTLKLFGPSNSKWFSLIFIDMDSLRILSCKIATRMSLRVRFSFTILGIHLRLLFFETNENHKRIFNGFLGNATE